MSKRPQINFPVKPDEKGLINKAQIALENRDGIPYNRKRAILKLCAEFLERRQNER